MQHHKYSLTELDEMVPWERQVYLDMIMAFLKEEADKANNKQ
jgi:hypothetical protein